MSFIFMFNHIFSNFIPLLLIRTSWYPDIPKSLVQSLYSPNLCYFSSQYMAPFFLFIAYEPNPPFTVSPPTAPSCSLQIPIIHSLLIPIFLYMPVCYLASTLNCYIMSVILSRSVFGWYIYVYKASIKTF